MNNGQGERGQLQGQGYYERDRPTTYGRGNIRGRGWPGQRRPARGRGKSALSRATITHTDENEEISDKWMFTTYGEKEKEICFESANTSNMDFIQFIIDSGATENLIKDSYKNVMFDIKDINEVKIYVANGEFLTSKQIGKISVTWQNEIITIQCLIVENLSYNLLSVRQLLAKGLEVKFHNNVVSICRGQKVIKGQLQANLYIINLRINIDNKCMLSREKDNDTSLWHRRLGHLNRKGLKILRLPVSNENCESCTEGKSTRRAFPETKSNSRQIGDLIHSDICGPIEPASINGEKYFQVIVDDYSHFVTVKLLIYKNEAEQNLIDYIKQVKTQLG